MTWTEIFGYAVFTALILIGVRHGIRTGAFQRAPSLSETLTHRVYPRRED